MSIDEICCFYFGMKFSIGLLTGGDEGEPGLLPELPELPDDPVESDCIICGPMPMTCWVFELRVSGL